MKKYIIILLLISSMLLTFYLSKEETSIEVNKVSKIDKVLEKPAGIQAYTINGEKTSISFNDLISNYVLDKIICKNGTTATYNKATNEVSLSNVKMPDYCTMNFKYTIYGKLLSDNSTIKTRSDFSETYTETTNKVLFKATEKNVHNTSGATVYYFAGNPVNNWVYFAGYYWRIIRTNADGSIKLLYHGTSPSSTSAYIKTSAYNSTNNDPMYAGYKYGTSGSLANNRLNTNDSTIKSAIDSWYYSNLLNYTKYLSKEAVYCNDRDVSKGYTYSTSSNFYYSFYSNALSTPSYDCTNEYDAFSGSNMSAYLKYPISLMSYYEVRFAGGRESSSTSQAWYYYNVNNVSSTGENHWWLLTPYNWDANYKRNLISRIYYDTGAIGRLKATEEHAVRPVISLKGNLTWKSGNGTSSSPYEVVLD